MVRFATANGMKFNNWGGVKARVWSVGYRVGMWGLGEVPCAIGHQKQVGRDK